MDTTTHAAQFPARLKQLRAAARMTQRELADRAGVHIDTVAKWEAGGREPLLTQLAALARALGVPPGDLFRPADV